MTCARRQPGEFGLAAYCYHNEQGWPAAAHGAAVWTTAGQAVDAIDTPVSLAKPALKRLLARGLHGPVIVVPEHPERWVFITRPALPPVAATQTLLAMNDVRCLMFKDRIELPPTKVPEGELTWLQPPGEGSQPLPFDAVAITILAVPRPADGEA